MNLDPTWIVFGLAVAWFAWTRFGGKVAVAEARRLVEGGALLLDVRTPMEFASGALPGAVNIPVSDLAQRLAEVGDTSRAIVVYCASGARSARATAFLKQQGYTKAVDLGPKSRW